MERLTYFDGGKWRLKIGDTEYSGEAVDRLAAYEDTGLEPEEVLPKEYAGEIMKSMILLKEYQKLGPIDRLRELKQADDEGRCVVLPDAKYTDTDGETAYQSIGIQQLDRWQKPGDITDVPRRINSYQYARYGSSRHMKSSNHLRLKTVTLSYNLPSKWMQAAGMRNVRIFASGNNLLTWAAYKNIDPEQPVNGVATWALPNLKSVTFGIEIGL